MRKPKPPSQRQTQETDYLRARIKLSVEQGETITPQIVWDWIKMRNPGLNDDDVEFIYRDVEDELRELTPVPTEEQLNEVQSRVEC